MDYILVIALLWNAGPPSNFEVGRYSTLAECEAAAQHTETCRGDICGTNNYVCIRTPHLQNNPRS